MSIVRRTRADIEKAKLLVELATRPRLSEEEIDAQVAEDGDAWTDEELAERSQYIRFHHRTSFVPSQRGWG